MKFVRFGPAGSELPGMLDEQGHVRSLREHLEDIDARVFDPAVRQRLAHIKAETLPLVHPSVRLGPCIARVPKIVGVGLNYFDHAAESNLPAPSEPILFFKATSSISGPNDPIELPKGCEKLDWEVELGVVIGKRAKNVPKELALGHVGAYLIVHDVSERAWQIERGGQWMKGKSHDTFSPIGPWLVTPDEIEDVQNLPLRCRVNDKIVQDGTTREMIFDVAHLVSYISHFMTLEPGDIITTGTPKGVGLGMRPPKYLALGDTVELEIRGLGMQRQIVN